LKKVDKINSKLNVLDLFSGCGGLSYSFMKQGFNIVAGIDNWEDALVTFEKNHPGAKGIILDLASLDAKDLDNFFSGNIDVIIGGPPCQGFSISGKRDPNDPRNSLYKSFLKIVDYLKPKAFVLENVPNLLSMKGGKIKEELLKDFGILGYDIKYKILMASDFGVPQNRRRAIFVGMYGKNRFKFPEGKVALASKISCSEAISDLPEYSKADGTENSIAPKSQYQILMRKNTNKIFNHQITNHSHKTIQIINLVPDGGNYKDLPEHLQKTRKVNIAWTRYSSNKPSLTIDTGHRHHFHYIFNRIPTVRESARLQSFPDDFIFSGSKTSQYKQVGNAVPPLLAEEIAKSLLKALSIK